ncbi:S8 family serine peptidase [Solwaraspora sp. WMMD791]|uniref:S8 family serine peptidase n=1 Tax=Solwaraspora sp. WMMD791 TaxID=3016086 RepID=UPI00249B48E1|nr:S8 family serine peptidase [Solwaraspora sp. WMMD791]WFE27730.1 S8 family serine peptidase [Solwaraspora sp. WMMD791]
MIHPPGRTGPPPAGIRYAAVTARAVAATLAIVLGVTAATAAAPAASAAPIGGNGDAPAAVSAELLADLAADGTTSFMVYLRETATLDAAARISDRARRSTVAYEQLTEFAERSQRELTADLTRRKVPHTSFWIANAVQVTGDRALVDAIAARPEVARVEPVRSHELIEPVTQPSVADDPQTTWGVEQIGAPRVWSEFGVRGETVVIASIDTGVQFDHPALVASYRGNLGDGTFDHDYNWFDPSGVCPDPTPCDNQGHGSHTVGTMVGDDGAGARIGVAPGARWIAAKGCEARSCSDPALLAAGQWVLAPTDRNGENPRPDLRPDIVNNSWGGGQADLWYEQVVTAWRAAGIFPVFSAGNDGPACNTASSPGDYPGVYTVGAHDVDGTIADFSSRGASGVDGHITPDIAAPGVGTVSAIPGSQYGTADGTSMAAPHVAGTVALLWSAAPALRNDYDATVALLDRTAIDVDATECGGTVADNNLAGEGRLDAYQLVAQSPRAQTGRLTGTVTDAADGSPVAGVTVTVAGRSVQTGPTGGYATYLPAGTHTLTVSGFGWTTRTLPVTVGTVPVNLDVALDAVPLVTLSGRVTDGSGQGWPLYARIDIAGRPGRPVFTDPTSGRYAVQVPRHGTYQVTVTALYPGYRTVTTEVAVGGQARTANLAVAAHIACTAAGYTADTGATVFAADFATEPAGWTVVDRTDGGGWTFTDHHQRGNLTGGAGGFAIVDSDGHGLGRSQDTLLHTPMVDISQIAAPVLRFRTDARIAGNGDVAAIDVSTNGTEWVNVSQVTESVRGPRLVEIPLAPVAGADQVQVRFRYRGGYSWWWQVDDVAIVDRTCTPVEGGLIAGFTSDANTGEPVVGARVADPQRPDEYGTSAATPADETVPDGFYWFFASGAGQQRSFVAEAAPYQQRKRTASVVAGGARRVDFDLRSGQLTVSGAPVEAELTDGGSGSAEFTVRNTGTAPVTVEVLARPAPAATPPLSGQPPWQRLADAPDGLSDNAAVVLDGIVYSIGGGTHLGTTRQAWAYDLAADSWQRLPDLPRDRGKPAVAAVDGKVYVFGGWDTEFRPQSAVDVFDPATGVWQTLAGVTNPAPRAAAAAVVVEGLIYLVGGCRDELCRASADVLAFDPTTGTFRARADYPHEVAWHACGAIDLRIYCAGGFSHDGDYADTLAYDPDTDRWSARAAMPEHVTSMAYSVAAGRLVLAGGMLSAGEITDRTIGYDPVADAWQELAPTGHAAFRGAGACGGLAIGGMSPQWAALPSISRWSGAADGCAPPAEVPWLRVRPASFTLAPGASKAVTLRFTADAATGVDGPGRYIATVALRAQTPYPVPTVPVELTVRQR